MIAVHRLTQPDQSFLLNPDQIETVESTPDTVVTLLSGHRFVVAESPAQVAELVTLWRARIAGAVLEGTGEGRRARLAAVVAGPGLSGSVGKREQSQD